MFYKAKTLRTQHWHPGRSDTYLGTVIQRNDPELLQIKQESKLNNAWRREHTENMISRNIMQGNHTQEEIAEMIDGMLSWKSFDRIRLMGRGPRKDLDYTWKDSYVRLADAKSFDVYRLHDYTAEERFKDRMKRKYAPVYMELQDAEWQVRRLQWKLQWEDRND